MYETQRPDAASIAESGPDRAHATSLNPSLACQTLDVDGRAVISLTGELDLATAPELLRQLRTLLDRPVDAVTIDLAELSFIDSSGLGALCRAREEAIEHGIPLELDRVPGHARRVLEVTGLASLFHLG